MPTWMWAATILQSLGSMFTLLLTMVCFTGPRMVFGGAGFWASTGAGDVWSLAVYKGELFIGRNNGGRGTVLAIRVGCLSLERLIRF